MASFSNNTDGEGDNLCESICKLIQRNDASAEPVIDIVEDEDEDACNTGQCDTSNIINDDELNDLVEEQLLLERIKQIQNAGINLETDSFHTDKKSSPLTNKDDSIHDLGGNDKNDDDSDSLLDFMTGSDSYNEEGHRKEDLDRISKALTLNVLMRSELSALESFLVEKLKRNQQLQLEVKNEISWLAETAESSIGEKSSSWYTKFGIPYFKDERNFSCGCNLDVKKMKSAGQVLTININYSCMWTMKEKSWLEEGVRNKLVEEYTSDLSTEEKNLQREFQRNKSARVRNDIKQEMKHIKEKIQKIESKSLIDLFPYHTPDREFDWVNISFEHVRNHSPVECQRIWHLYVKPSVNKKKWSIEEDCRLGVLVDKSNCQDWDMIAQLLETRRTGYQCFINYQTRLNKDLLKVGKWTEEEDKTLISLISKCRVGDFIPWTKIAYYFQGRSLSQIYARWKCSLNPDLKKGRFTKQEDKKIVMFVRRFGEDFKKISKLIGDRTSVQIRERYFRAIPAKYQNLGRWSLDEDKLLIDLVKKHGLSNWSAVSKQFVTRSRTQIRQRYNIIKKIMDENPNLEPENFHRGPKAKALSNLSLPTKDKEDRLLSDIIEEHKTEEALFRRENGILITKIKTGRRKINRSLVDKQLINYFKEVYTSNNLKLKTHYIKPESEKAINAMALFCQFLRTHITFPDNNSKTQTVGQLSPTLRNLVQKMEKRFTNWGCDCLHPLSSNQFSLCFCHQQNSIDCFPVNVEATLIDESDYLLQCNTTPIKVNKTKCKCINNRPKHCIPYYLPPNIITAIGFRSVMLIKDKISRFLSYDQTSSSRLYFPSNDIIHYNGLKAFTGYFSDESHDSADGDEDEVASTNSTVNLLSKSVPSTSTFIPVSTYKTQGFIEATQNEKSVQSQKSLPRLSKQDAVNLWKERLMAILSWPIVLSNHSQTFSGDFEASDDETVEKSPERSRLRKRNNHSKFVSDKSMLLESNWINKNMVGRRKNTVSSHDNFSESNTDFKAFPSVDPSNEFSGGLFQDFSCSMSYCNDIKQTEGCSNSDKCLEKDLKEVQCNTNILANGGSVIQEHSSCNETFKQKECSSSNDTKQDCLDSSDLVVNKISKCYSRKRIHNQAK